MRTFLWYLFVVYSIALVIRLLMLAFSDYPRAVKFSREIDVLSFVWSLGTFAWVTWLLFAEGGAR